MSAYLAFVIVGLVSGSAYALISLGLVSTYRTSGIFNFGYSAVSMVAAFSFYSLHITEGLPSWVALVLSVLVICPIVGVVLDRLIFARLMGGQVAAQIVSTIGLLVAVQTLAVIVYGGNTLSVPQFLPTGIVRIGSLNVGWNQIIVVAAALAAAMLLREFYQRTKLGLNTRALVNNSELTRLEGVNVGRVTSTSWAIGSAFAGLAGVVLVPLIGLDSTALTLLVVQAFGAAAIGGLRSLPWAYGGSMAVGVLTALATKWTTSVSALVGLPNSVPFIALFLAIILVRRVKLPEIQRPVLIPRRILYFQHRVLRFGTWGIWLVAVAVVPVVLSGSWLLAATAAGGFAIVFSGLYIVLRLSRQTSLCHAVFVATGIVTVSHLSADGVPFGLALLISGLIAAVVGVAVSLPAVRLSGLHLALATFAFGLLVQQLVWSTNLGFGVGGQVTVPRPAGFTGNAVFYWLVLGVALVTIVAVNALVRSRLGGISRAIADSELATTSLGIRASTVRVLVFAMSAFIAAIGGGLIGSLYGTVTLTQFTYSQSLMFVAVLVTAGIAGQSGVVLGAVLFAAVPSIFTWEWLANWSGVFFGINAIIYAGSPEGIIGPNRRFYLTLKRHIIPSAGPVTAPVSFTPTDGDRPSVATRETAHAV